MTTASTLTQPVPSREVSLARFGAASHRTFRASSGEVEVNGEKHPQLSTNVTVVTAAIGTEIMFCGFKSSMTAFHEASNTFVSVEKLYDIDGVSEHFKALLHEDRFFNDPRNHFALDCFEELLKKNLKSLESAFLTPLDNSTSGDTAAITREFPSEPLALPLDEMTEAKSDPIKYWRGRNEAEQARIRADAGSAEDYLFACLERHMSTFCGVVANELSQYAHYRKFKPTTYA
jgi:hypothetical protein